MFRAPCASCAAVLAVVAANAEPASAGGATLTGSYVGLYEEIPEAIFVETQIVGPGIEFSVPNAQPPFEAFAIDVSSDQIIFQPLDDDVFAPSSFNGFVLVFSHAPAFSSVTQDPTSFFPSAPISFTSDEISFNLSGLAVSPRDKLVLDVAFASSPPAATAPEPSTWALALIGFAGLAYADARRRRFAGSRLTRRPAVMAPLDM